MNSPDHEPSAQKVRAVADRPDLLTDSQARRAYALLLVRTLWPAISGSDARRIASWIVKGKSE